MGGKGNIKDIRRNIEGTTGHVHPADRPHHECFDWADKPSCDKLDAAGRRLLGMSLDVKAGMAERRPIHGRTGD